MSWLVDDAPVDMPKETHDGEILDGGHLLEIIGYSSLASMDQINTIASGKKIEFKICNDEFSLSSRDMVDLKEFVSQVKAISKP